MHNKPQVCLTDILNAYFDVLLIPVVVICSKLCKNQGTFVLNHVILFAVLRQLLLRVNIGVGGLTQSHQNINVGGAALVR